MTAVAPCVDETMRVFTSELLGIFGYDLIAVILHGSAVLGDFRPGKGDLDFVVVTNDDLSPADCEKLFSLHDALRSGMHGPLAAQLEGTYYPLSIVRDPNHARGNGCYVGTGRGGWKQVASSRNSASDYAVISRYGVFYGTDIRESIYSPSDNELVEEFRKSLNSNLKDIHREKGIWYAVSMFHWAARGLCHAMTGELLSKKDAARWFASSSFDPMWTELVLHAERYRYPFSDADLKEIDPRITSLLGRFLEYVRDRLTSR
jgi:hypothetical protein